MSGRRNELRLLIQTHMGLVHQNTFASMERVIMAVGSFVGQDDYDEDGITGAYHVMKEAYRELEGTK